MVFGTYTELYMASKPNSHKNKNMELRSVWVSRKGMEKMGTNTQINVLSVREHTIFLSTLGP